MGRLIFVLLDGLNAKTARSCMSFLNALDEAAQISHVTLTSFLPPLSRPLYACLLSGLTPANSGIVRNEDTQLCPAPTFFHQARKVGLTTAAAAYYWFSELCNLSPFNPARDRLTVNTSLPIAHGLFYSDDAYPDAELFRDAEALRHRVSPDLLLVHSMGIDWAGHCHGGTSVPYTQAVRHADSLLARYLPLWLKEGYSLLITSDHGMDANGNHYDDAPDVRQVPLWQAGPVWKTLPQPASQADIADLVCMALGIPLINQPHDI